MASKIEYVLNIDIFSFFTKERIISFNDDNFHDGWWDHADDDLKLVVGGIVSFSCNYKFNCFVLLSLIVILLIT